MVVVARAAHTQTPVSDCLADFLGDTAVRSHGKISVAIGEMPNDAMKN